MPIIIIVEFLNKVEHARGKKRLFNNLFSFVLTVKCEYNVYKKIWSWLT